MKLLNLLKKTDNGILLIVGFILFLLVLYGTIFLCAT